MRPAPSGPPAGRRLTAASEQAVAACTARPSVQHPTQHLDAHAALSEVVDGRTFTSAVCGGGGPQLLARHGLADHAQAVQGGLGVDARPVAARAEAALLDGEFEMLADVELSDRRGPSRFSPRSGAYFTCAVLIWYALTESPLGTTLRNRLECQRGSSE